MVEGVLFIRVQGFPVYCMFLFTFVHFFPVLYVKSCFITKHVWVAFLDVMVWLC